MKIVIAYHCYLYGDFYDTLIGSQFSRLVSSKLFKACDKMYIGIVEHSPVPGSDWVIGYFESPKAEAVIYPDNQELRCTLRWMRDYAKDNPEDYILFFHSKGVTNYEKPPIVYEAVADWRRYMEYFVIDRWKDCIAKLGEGFDACGVLWNTDTPLGYFPHFSGAFYCVKASYINTLDHSYLEKDWRYGGEMWIGTNLEAKIYEFHNSRLNDKEPLMTGASHYYIRYPMENYVVS